MVRPAQLSFGFPTNVHFKTKWAYRTGYSGNLLNISYCGLNILAHRRARKVTFPRGPNTHRITAPPVRFVADDIPHGTPFWCGA